MDQTAISTVTDPPRMEGEVDIHALRESLIECEARLTDARDNVAMAAVEIARIEKLLHGWKRYSAYQSTRVVVLEHRIRAERDQLRMEEDYASGVA